MLKESEKLISAKKDINKTLRNHNTTMENNRSVLKNMFCIYFLVNRYSLQSRFLYYIHQPLLKKLLLDLKINIRISIFRYVCSSLPT